MKIVSEQRYTYLVSPPWMYPNYRTAFKKYKSYPNMDWDTTLRYHQYKMDKLIEYYFATHRERKVKNVKVIHDGRIAWEW